MERTAIKELYAWKERQDRKPLLFIGARQVGKTWLMLNFAQKAFPRCIYINFELEESLRNMFESDLDTKRILSTISLTKGVEIDSDTLIIFDEIQAAPRGVTSLKYFCEEAPQYPIMAAGSLLELSMHNGDSFPVGKVDMVELYPLSFHEFLLATGHQMWADVLVRKDFASAAMIDDKLQTLLRDYYYVGGMPAAVKAYIENKGYNEVRRIQNDLLSMYENDFSKHAPVNEVPRIRMVWHSIGAQLAKENKKFIYGMVRQGARAKDFEVAIEWLRDAGLIYRVPRIKKTELPLAMFEDFAAFKIYMLDVGLMGAMNGLPSSVYANSNELFATAKGAFAEQYVLQQIVQLRCDYVGYWSAENAQAEMDFVVQQEAEILPIEVKAEDNLKAKSLHTFIQKHPSLHGLRFSMRGLRQQEWMTNYPLYALPMLLEKENG